MRGYVSVDKGDRDGGNAFPQKNLISQTKASDIIDAIVPYLPNEIPKEFD